MGDAASIVRVQLPVQRPPPARWGASGRCASLPSADAFAGTTRHPSTPPGPTRCASSHRSSGEGFRARSIRISRLQIRTLAHIRETTQRPPKETARTHLSQPCRSQLATCRTNRADFANMRTGIDLQNRKTSAAPVHCVRVSPSTAAPAGRRGGDAAFALMSDRTYIHDADDRGASQASRVAGRRHQEPSILRAGTEMGGADAAEGAGRRDAFAAGVPAHAGHRRALPRASHPGRRRGLAGGLPHRSGRGARGGGAQQDDADHTQARDGNVPVAVEAVRPVEKAANGS